MITSLELGEDKTETGAAFSRNRTGCWHPEELPQGEVPRHASSVSHQFPHWESGSHTSLTLPYFLGSAQLSPNRTRKPSSEAVFPEGPNPMCDENVFRKWGSLGTSHPKSSTCAPPKPMSIKMHLRSLLLASDGVCAHLCVCVHVCKRERKWRWSIWVLISWTEARPMPLAGPSSWLPEVGSSGLVRDHRASFKSHLTQTTTP